MLQNLIFSWFFFFWKMENFKINILDLSLATTLIYDTQKA